MMASTAPTIPTGMRRIYRRFERWRKSHPGRLPIPQTLWDAAVEVAREQGVGRTAQILRLEYGKLKRMVESESAVGKAAAEGAAFVELVAPQAVGLSECLVELEGPRGKMRIQWKGTTVPDLAGVSRGLWESGSK
jgi:hypothetical protein